MKNFPSIEQFRNVIRNVHHKAHFDCIGPDGKPVYKRSAQMPTLNYRGTVKCHGSCSGIVRKPDGSIEFQSKERVLSLEEDNLGFMAYMVEHIVTLNLLMDLICKLTGNSRTSEVSVFGEWCGGNIQKGVGLNGLPRMFIMFAVKIDDEWVNMDVLNTAEAVTINIYNVIHFPKFELQIDFENPHEIQNKLVELTIQVEDECPVAKDFGVSGVGEGIVWQCTDPGYNSSKFWFKTKGEKHSVSRVKVLAEVDVEAIRNINEFVDAVVTDQRLEQGLHNLQHEQLKPFAIKSMGDFIRWVYNDVVKEESDRITASELDAKKLGSPIANKARKWFIAKLDADAGLT